ncbi:MFS transporter [Saccharopolyspora aridisoli]|uniref:MFS transporter n=1 Tax=Saccharopolyspora aridisoli TaxID=2530385 RepID=A0A4R4V057_9PSEU|nr:MFS transporter [Saccharopolyspora aridisoli]
MGFRAVSRRLRRPPGGGGSRSTRARCAPLAQPPPCRKPRRPSPLGSHRRPARARPRPRGRRRGHRAARSPNAATVTAALAATPGATMWILSSMSTGLAVSLLTAGALADQSGRRRVFELGAWVFAAGSMVCATAATATQFVIGRLVEGVGAAGLIATGLGLVAAVTSDAGARSVSASWWGASMGLGIALGPLLTGVLDFADLWRAPYWLLAAVGVSIAIAARWCFPEKAVIPGRRLDLLGAALMTSGLGLLLVALVEGRQGGLASALVCAGVAVAALVAFAISQLRSRSPMVELALFRRGDFVAATVAATATGAGVIATDVVRLHVPGDQHGDEHPRGQRHARALVRYQRCLRRAQPSAGRAADGDGAVGNRPRGHGCRSAAAHRARNRFDHRATGARPSCRRRRHRRAQCRSGTAGDCHRPARPCRRRGRAEQHHPLRRCLDRGHRRRCSRLCPRRRHRRPAVRLESRRRAHRHPLPRRSCRCAGAVSMRTRAQPRMKPGAA